MAELLVNNARTTLVGTINSSVTSLVVNSATDFPATGNFRIVIDTELMLVTGVATDTFTVTRGIESSTAASHSSGATIAQVLTNGGLDQYIKDRTSLRGTHGSRPAAGKTGLIYFPTDEAYLYRDNGSTWDAAGPIFPVTLPVFGDFTLFNGTNTTNCLAADNGDSIWFEDFANAGLSLRILKKAAPSTPWIIDVWMENLTYQITNGFGIGFRQNAGGGGSGKLHTLLMQIESASPLNYYRAYTALWNSATSFASSYGDAPWTLKPRYFRMLDDGVNREFWIGNDGVHWFMIHSLARTTDLTPDEVFFFIYSQNASNKAGVHLLSWYEH